MPSYNPSLLTRRAAVKLTTASLALAACTPKTNADKKHVAVIGAGIVGASIAYHLAKAGVTVTILERGEIAQRASRGTFAWINATWAKQPQSYHTFNQAGLAGWKMLQAELNIPVKWGGSIEWFPSEARQDKLAQQIAEQVEWGEPAKMLSGQELQALEPNVDFSSTDRAANSPKDGAVDPVFAAQTLIENAVKMGATLKTQCAVESATNLSGGKTRLTTNCGEIDVDQFILATGADPEASKALAGIHIPQRSTPGIIVITKPQPKILNRILVAPGVHIHQRLDGRIVLGEQEGAPDTEAHTRRLKNRPTEFPHPDFAEQHTMQILSVAEQYVPGIIGAAIEDVFIGWRPLPLDGHPVLGPSPANPNAYLAIMHSGVSLAPIVGDVVAKEIVTGESADVLSAYRPDRKIERVKRY